VAGSGLHSVELTRKSGIISLVRPQSRTATLSAPGQPDRHVALPRRTLRDCIAEELRRLDADEVYADVLGKGLALVDRQAGPGAKAATAKATATKAATTKAATAKATVTKPATAKAAAPKATAATANKAAATKPPARSTAKTPASTPAKSPARAAKPVAATGNTPTRRPARPARGEA
jgi:hypothetical protein